MIKGALVAHELPDLPRTYGIEHGEAYFPDLQDFIDWFRRNDIATRAPDWPEHVFAAADCVLTASFRPEVWVRDQAMAVDPEGDTDWTILASDLEIRSGDLDFLTRSANAPQWIRDWSGPFTIDLVIEFPDALSEHARLSLRRRLKELLPA